MANPLVPYQPEKPNWTYGRPSTPSMQPRLGGPQPGSALMDPKRPNWTTPGPQSGGGLRGGGLPMVERVPQPLQLSGPAVPPSLRNVLARGASMAGKVAAPLAVAGAIGNSTEEDSTARYAKRFGVSEPTGDGSFGDIAKFAGLRAGGFASDLGNILTGGLAGKMFEDADMPRPDAGAGLVMPPQNEMGDPTEGQFVPPGLGSLPAMNAAAVPRPDQRSIEGTQPSTPDGQILRTGNSYTSTGGPVGANAQVYNPDGTLRNQGVGGGRVSVLPTSQGFVQDLKEIGRLQTEAAERAKGYNTAASGFGGATLASELTRKVEDARNPGAALARQQLEQQGLTERARDATLRRGQDIDFKAAEMRDSTTARGQDINARTAAAQARLEQANKDRTYQMDVQKFGVETAEKNRTARADEDKAVTSQLETRFRTKDDKGKDVADTARVAQYKQAVAATLPVLVQKLRQQGSPEAVARADAVEKRGLAALDASDHDKFQRMLETRELARGSKGVLYGGSNFTDSDNLFDFAQRPGAEGVEKGLRANRAVLANGTSIDERKLRYGADANVIQPNWLKTENTNLTRGLRLE